MAVYMAERNQARDRVLQLRAELGARAPVMATAVKTIEPVGFVEKIVNGTPSVLWYVDFPNVAAKVKTLDQLYTSLPEHTAVMRAAAEAIESLLSLIRRNAPELSGKVIGWAERDLAALRAALGTFDVPVQPMGGA